MREGDDLASRLKRAETELVNIKSSQPITGDSWQTYRYTLSVDLVVGQRKYILFTLKNPDITTMAKIEDYLSFDLYPICCGYQNGVFLWVAPGVPYTNETRTIGITSSQPGVLSVVTTAPF